MSPDILEYLEDDEETHQNTELSVTLEGDGEAVGQLLEDGGTAPYQEARQPTSPESDQSFKNNLKYKAATLGFGAGFAATITEAYNALPHLEEDAEKFMEYAPEAIDAASSFGEVGGALATGLGAIYCYSRIKR